MICQSSFTSLLNLIAKLQFSELQGHCFGWVPPSHHGRHGSTPIFLHASTWRSNPTSRSLQQRNNIGNCPATTQAAISLAFVFKILGNNSISSSCVDSEFLKNIPGHALHEKGLQGPNKRRYTGQQPGTKSAFRPGDEPVVNRGFCSSVGFKYELDCSCFRKDVQDSVRDLLGGKREGLFLGRIDPTASRPTQPRSAPPPRRAPPRPDRPVVCLGFGFDNSYLSTRIYFNLSNPKSRHTTGRSGRGGARRGGGAGRGWVGLDAVGSIRPRNNPSLLPPSKSRTLS